MRSRRLHRRQPALDPKVEAVLVRLVAETEGQSLQKTQAVKLPYIVDVVAQHVLGRRITRATYEPWEHGVVATEVYDMITNARYERGESHLRNTPFVVEEPEGFEDRQNLGLKVSASDDLLSEEEREIVEFVAVQYGRLNPRKLGAITKALNDHIVSWPSTKPVRVNEEAYDRLPVGCDDVDLEIARLRLDEVEGNADAVVRGRELHASLAKLG